MFGRRKRSVPEQVDQQVPEVPTVTRVMPLPILPDQRTFEDWFQQAGEKRPPRRNDVLTLRDYLKSKDPKRWARMQGDLRWAEDELAKFGLIPEDVRWVL